MKSISVLRIAVVITAFYISPAFSQCTVIIPSDAHVFDSSKTVSSSGADIIGSNWICAGDTLVITSGFGSQTFFLEENAVLYGGGGGSRTVFLKPGAFFDGGGGGSQVITYDTTGSYANCGSVYPTYCHPLIFDYSIAPLSGCNVATSVRNISSELKMKIYPEPADDFVWIDFNERQNHDCFMRVFNSAGKEIFKQSVSKFPFGLKTSTLTEGIYFVTLLDDAATLRESKLIISR